VDKILADLPPGSGVAALRLRSLGDTLLMTPALHALHQWRPDLRLAALVEPRFSALLRGNPEIGAVIEVPAAGAGRWRAARALRAARPALVLGLHGGTTAAWLARVSGAPHRATFRGLRHRWAYNLFTPAPAPPPGRAAVHTVEHVGSLLVALGLPPPPGGWGPLRLFPASGARRRMRARLAECGIAGRFAFLAPEAREPRMRWPAERFAALAARLRAEHGLAAVSASPGAVVPVAGVALCARTSVEELIALVAEAALVVANDGGPVHIAAALGVPVVAFYSSTVLEIWSPWQVPCRCLQRASLADIEVDEAAAAATALLAAAPGG
jgi:ADP-heptose:LPS heptosyltransferase